LLLSSFTQPKVWELEWSVGTYTSLPHSLSPLPSLLDFSCSTARRRSSESQQQ